MSKWSSRQENQTRRELLEVYREAIGRLPRGFKWAVIMKYGLMELVEELKLEVPAESGAMVEDFPITYPELAAEMTKLFGETVNERQARDAVQFAIQHMMFERGLSAEVAGRPLFIEAFSVFVHGGDLHESALAMEN